MAPAVAEAATTSFEKKPPLPGADAEKTEKVVAEGAIAAEADAADTQGQATRRAKAAAAVVVAVAVAVVAVAAVPVAARMPAPTRSTRKPMAKNRNRTMSSTQT